MQNKYFFLITLFIAHVLNSAQESLVPKEPSLTERIEALPDDIIDDALKPFLFPNNILYSPWLLSVTKLIIRSKTFIHINNISISPDSKFILVCIFSHVEIYDLKTGDLFKTIKYTAPVTYATLSADSRFIAICSQDNTAQIFDLNTEELINTINHDDFVVHASISSDSRFIVTCSRDHTSKITDFSTGRLLKKIKHKNWVTSCTISPDSRFVITCSNDCTSKIFDLHTRKILNTIQHNSFLRSAVISSDSSRVATCSNNKIIIIDLRTGKFLKTIKLNTFVLHHIIINPDLRSAIIFCYGHSVKIIDLKTAKVLNTIAEDHAIIVRDCPETHLAILSNDKKFLVNTNGNSDTLEIIDLRTRSYIKQLNFLQIKFINWLYTQKSQNKCLYSNPDLPIPLDSKQLEIFKSLPENYKKRFK